MADTAVKQLLDTINSLKFKVDDLERRLELIESRMDLRETISLRDVRRPPYWRENDITSAVARHGTYTDLGDATITAETEDGTTITLTQGPRTVREAEEALLPEDALLRINNEIRNQYMTTGVAQDAIVLDYSAIRNAPNAVTHIQSAQDALIVDFVDGQRQFIPLHISRGGMI